ncbi:hypothetical protein [Melittangium boletus]|uniref:Uncharacterized protein n=1 Tax=Melittangium boletus DSM 14713 TaxID=1294270 RepID=A0A250ILP0_9BACT|nr:hypothetical protein [Melittangium boletus]ATB32173.1 hypothetical protein MEBOL_005649 [Melittangium boletus DSM 14713]
MNSSKPLLEPLRVRIRRFQFIVGLGFLALILGSILSVGLSQRLAGRVQALPFDWLRFAIGLGVQKLWVLAVLPGLCYGAARVIDLRALPTALGAAVSGQVFILALEFVQDGVDGWVERGWIVIGLEWAVFALGVWLGQLAVKRGRVAATTREAQVRERASVRADEYAEFLREAERAGEKIAQRDEAKASEVAETAGASAPESSEPATGEKSKTPAA